MDTLLAIDIKNKMLTSLGSIPSMTGPYVFNTNGDRLGYNINNINTCYNLLKYMLKFP